MTFVNNPSTIPGMSEVLRTSLKRVTLKGHKDPLPILIPGQRPQLFQSVPYTANTSNTLPCQLLSLCSDTLFSCSRICPTRTPVSQLLKFIKKEPLL